MTILWCDFETRSRCDLPQRGAYNYMLDGSTSVLCLSYAFDDEDVATWLPGQPVPDRVRHHTGQIRAHNATFERLAFLYLMDLPFKLEQFYCTAAQSRANCGPGSLEDVGRFHGASMRKDHRGAQLIRLLSMPQADGNFRDDPDLMAEMIAYCEQDVRAMRAVSTSLRQLSDEELSDYHVSERINDRGVRVDAELCRAATQYSDAENAEIEAIVAEVTNGEVTSVRSPRMREWVYARVGPLAQKMMTVYKDDVARQSIDKVIRANLLVLADENPEEVPEDVAEVIQCADDMWSSSVAKFRRLSALADDEDSRVRGAFVFCGGAQTGRDSSYGAQVHNFARKCARDPEAVRHAVVRGHALAPKFGKRVTDVLKGMLRPALLPAPGHVFVVADWSAIEGRVNPWLADSAAGERKLDVFRSGRDPYIVNGAATFRVSYEEIERAYAETGTDERRQIGKVEELACGFGGAAGAFAAMGRAYGVYMSDGEMSGAVKAWRRANPWAQPWWNALEDAYLRAMRNPGREFSAGRVAYLYDGTHLWWVLPSGRVLCYPHARLEAGEVTYAKCSWKPAADAAEWPRARLWKGLACENVTQACAHDLLRHARRSREDVVLHVHDELVFEVPEGSADEAAAHVLLLMRTCPPWAAGLPLDAQVKVMSRYGKG
jgi:DNA polymerase